MTTNLESEIRSAAEGTAGIVRLRLLAAADVLAGADPRRVGFDSEVPPDTVRRWASVARVSGVQALAQIPLPEVALDGMHPDLPALAACNASPGLERTSLAAVAAACRGASVDELATHHTAAPAEIREWIEVYLSRGAFGMRFHYRDPRWSPDAPEQVFLRRRRLPYGMNASFLRQLHMRSSGDFAKRLLVMALLYEGRTVRQVAQAVEKPPYTVEQWVKDFIRHGLPGLALKPQITLVPRRKGFNASSVAALAADVDNAEMRKRLSVVELAYRSVSLHGISTRVGTNVASVRAYIVAFEKDGIDGLSTGEATLTPPLRDDYSSARLQEIASGMDDDEPGRRHVMALAALYDGVSMAEAARQTSGLTGIRIMVDRFNRLGHGAVQSFKPLMRPTAPPHRKLHPPSPPSTPVKMRKDLNAMRLRRVRDAYKPDGRERIDIIVEAYAGRTIQEIVARRHRSAPTVRKYLDSFNDLGLEWLEEYKKKSPKADHRIASQAVVPIRRDISPQVIREAVFRSIDRAHRADLSIMHDLYQNNGRIGDIPERAGVTEAEVARLAAAFDLYGETFGHASNSRMMLPSEWDAQALLGAQMRPEPLRSYAHVVVWLYAGVEPDVIKKKFEMPQSELETVVLAFRERGVAGLEADPLDAARNMPRHRNIAPSPPMRPPVPKVASPPARHQPGRPVGRPPKVVAGHNVPPPPVAPRPPAAVVSPALDPKAIRSLYEGRNARRLDAARDFGQSKNVEEVSARFGVSPATLEKWVVDYVKCGMAEIDRQAAKQGSGLR